MMKTRAENNVRLREGAKVLQWQRVLVCLICFVLVAVFVVGYYISDQRTRATGLAQDLYYAATEYMVACAVDGKAPKYDGSDADHYLITNPKTLENLMKEPIDAEFTVFITKKKAEIFGVKCVHKTIVASYVLESIGVFPADSGQSGARWYQRVDVKPEVTGDFII